MVADFTYSHDRYVRRYIDMMHIYIRDMLICMILLDNPTHTQPLQSNYKNKLYYDLYDWPFTQFIILFTTNH